jgi:flagellar secretion chaperone FliS
MRRHISQSQPLGCRLNEGAEMEPSPRYGKAGTYQNVAAWTGVSTADPHRLILMMFDGALARVAAARGCMEHGRVAEKGQLVSRALAIVDELRSSLDIERGGTIAASLDDLYDYMSRRLVEANATNRLEILDEVTTLLRELRDAWVTVNAGAQHPA